MESAATRRLSRTTTTPLRLRAIHWRAAIHLQAHTTPSTPRPLQNTTTKSRVRISPQSSPATPQCHCSQSKWMGHRFLKVIFTESIMGRCFITKKHPITATLHKRLHLPLATLHPRRRHHRHIVRHLRTPIGCGSALCLARIQQRSVLRGGSMPSNLLEK